MTGNFILRKRNPCFFFFFRHFNLWLRSVVEEDIAEEKISQNRDKKAPISDGNHSKTTHIGDTDRNHQGKGTDAFPATTRARTTTHSRQPRRPTKTPARSTFRPTTFSVTARYLAATSTVASFPTRG